MPSRTGQAGILPCLSPLKFVSFAFFPNIDDWLPGDLVLVSPVNPDWIHRQISAAQVRTGYAAADAQWQHAAVYTGDGYVCDAGTSGVRYAPIFNYVGGHLIRVRRDFSLSSDERWRLVVQAIVRLGQPYNFREILSVYRSSLSMSWTSALRAQFVTRAKSVICSQLYATAYSAVAGKQVSRFVNTSVVPATLSLSAALTDVQLHWKDIV